MSDDQPTRDLDDAADADRQPTVEVRGDHRVPGNDDTPALPDRANRRSYPAPSEQPRPGVHGGGETQVLPDDLAPSPGGTRQGGHGYDPGDTQPIGLGDRWARRQARPPARPSRRQAGAWQQPPAEGWGRRPGGRARPGSSPEWAQPAPPAGWDQQGAPPGWRQLPQAGRAPGEPAPAGPRRRGQHLLVWVFTLLVALGLGAAAVLGPWAEPLGLSAQASTLAVIVVSLLAWVLLSAALRLAGILAFVLTPLLFLAGSVPELRQLPVGLPEVGGPATLLAMALGLVSWLAGHWFYYARKGWWRSRAAGALLGGIPGVEAAHHRPDQSYDHHMG